MQTLQDILGNVLSANDNNDTVTYQVCVQIIAQPQPFTIQEAKRHS